MKVPLIILFLIGVLWLGALAFQSRITPVFLLDAVLPPKVLAATTPEERTQIQERLRQVSASSYFSWIGAAAVVVLSGVALKMSTREALPRQ